MHLEIALTVCFANFYNFLWTKIRLLRLFASMKTNIRYIINYLRLTCLLILICSYIARINENSPQGTALLFMDPYVPQVNDDDAGKNGVFSLSLLNNNGTFEISPNVGERRANFIIKVRDNQYLDYEARQSVVFQVSSLITL